MKKIFLFLMGVLLIGLVSADLDDGCGMTGAYGMMTGMYGLGGMFFGWIFGLLVLAALVLLIVWSVKQVKK